MFQPYIDILDDEPFDDEFPGGISERESWWVERQEELEAAGYMLRPRYHRGLKRISLTWMSKTVRRNSYISWQSVPSTYVV
jgi:hypothetical protein